MAGETAVNRDMFTTQSDMALILSTTTPKKACLGEWGGEDGERISGNALGFRLIERTHERVVPQQQDISGALSRPFNNGDLRSANHATLATAIADIYHAHNISDHIVESHH